MPKALLYGIIIIVITSAILAGGWFFFIKDSGTETANANSSLTNTTATANANVVVPSVETKEGDTEVGATVTYNDTVFTFTSASRLKEWRGDTVAEGQEFLVVFYSPIEADVREATKWIRSDAKLVTGANQTLVPTQLKVVSTGGSTGDTGYFVFTVKTSDRDFRIGFKDTTTALGL